MNINDVVNILKERGAQHLNQQEGQDYAILLPLAVKDSKLYVIFEVRAKHLNSQPGEICFPGGKVDEDDESLTSAAIRETAEELGVEPHRIVDVYPLDYTVGNMNFYPFVGHLLEPQKIKPHPDEVDSIFMISLDELLAIKPLEHVVKLVPMPEDDFPFNLIPDGRDYRWFPRKMTLYFYLYEDKVIWGLTAQILHQFLEIIRGRD